MSLDKELAVKLVDAIRRHNQSLADSCENVNQHIGHNGEGQKVIFNYSQIGLDKILYRCNHCGHMYTGKKSPERLNRERHYTPVTI